MQAHDSDIYFDDIKMQMVAKDMASRYNQGGPPKAVDFLHAFVMEVLVVLLVPVVLVVPVGIPLSSTGTGSTSK